MRWLRYNLKATRGPLKKNKAGFQGLKHEQVFFFYEVSYKNQQDVSD